MTGFLAGKAGAPLVGKLVVSHKTSDLQMIYLICREYGLLVVSKKEKGEETVPVGCKQARSEHGMGNSERGFLSNVSYVTRRRQ